MQKQPFPLLPGLFEVFLLIYIQQILRKKIISKKSK